MQIIPISLRQRRQTCQTWFPPMTLARALCLPITVLALVISKAWVSSSKPMYCMWLVYAAQYNYRLSILSILGKKNEKAATFGTNLWNPLTTLLRYPVCRPKTFVSRERRGLGCHRVPWEAAYHPTVGQGTYGWPCARGGYHREPERIRYPRGARIQFWRFSLGQYHGSDVRVHHTRQLKKLTTHNCP